MNNIYVYILCGTCVRMDILNMILVMPWIEINFGCLDKEVIP